MKIKTGFSTVVLLLGWAAPRAMAFTRAAAPAPVAGLNLPVGPVSLEAPAAAANLGGDFAPAALPTVAAAPSNLVPAAAPAPAALAFDPAVIPALARALPSLPKDFAFSPDRPSRLPPGRTGFSDDEGDFTGVTAALPKGPRFPPTLRSALKLPLPRRDEERAARSLTRLFENRGRVRELDEEALLVGAGR